MLNSKWRPINTVNWHQPTTTVVFNYNFKYEKVTVKNKENSLKSYWMLILGEYIYHIKSMYSKIKNQNGNFIFILINLII